MTDKMVIKINPDFKPSVGVVKYTSWQRLEEILYAAGELNGGETVAGYTVDENGIQFYVENFY